MAQGEKNFSSEGVKVDRFMSEPVAPGQYDLKLMAAKAQIKKARNGQGLPYVNVMFDILGTGAEGGKNRKLFHMFFTSMATGKDGKMNPNRQGGISEFAHSLGDVFKARVLDVQEVTEDGQQRTVECINPQQLLAWLKQRDGATVSARVKIQKGTNGYSDQNKVDYFEASAAASEEAAEEETEWEEEGTEEAEEEAEETETEDEWGEDEEDAEIEEAPPAKVKVSSKVTPLGAKPKGKLVTKKGKK